MNLFEPEQWCYQVIATNIEDLGMEEIVWHHNGRGQAENLIKELKDRLWHGADGKRGSGGQRLLLLHWSIGLQQGPMPRRSSLCPKDG
jgi:hypothetical protein